MVRFSVAHFGIFVGIEVEAVVEFHATVSPTYLSLAVTILFCGLVMVLYFGVDYCRCGFMGSTINFIYVTTTIFIMH